MFESAELGRRVHKQEFDRLAPALRTELLALQQRLRQADFRLIIVFAGVDHAGKEETVNLLNAWMDPRWITTRAYSASAQEERERPEFWRYWRDLPPRGKIGLFLSAWYSRPVLERVRRRQSRVELDGDLERIVAFERALADDGALILKFWMHMSARAQAKRFKELERDPLQRWQVTRQDWRNLERFERFVSAAERTIMRTSTWQAPWSIVEGVDPQYRALAVTSTVRDALQRRLAGANVPATAAAPARQPVRRAAKRSTPPVTFPRHPTILDALDAELTLSRKRYEVELRREQGRVNKRCRKAKERGLSVILVFEGWDAAGKGGAIRRLTASLDAHDYEVIPIAAPSDEERAHHYLWRFWRHLSRAGRVTIFDRSWYGRVLVERVEGFATEEEWRRAYAEINDFEEQLVRHGIVLVKYWLHVTKEEQLRRFQEREKTPYKRWKLTDEDWRNREKWDLYALAVNEMVERTSTAIAPWTLVEANDKLYARVKVLRTLGEQLKGALRRPRG